MFWSWFVGFESADLEMFQDAGSKKWRKVVLIAKNRESRQNPPFKTVPTWSTVQSRHEAVMKPRFISSVVEHQPRKLIERGYVFFCFFLCV